MIQVQAPDSFVNTILGEQSVTRDEQYRLLSFCISTPVTEGILLYNNLTKELLFLSETEAGTASPVFDLLVKKWFYVPFSFNDRQFSDQLRLIAGLKMKSQGQLFTILTTTSCNARCFYCFEKGIPSYDMSLQTAQDVIGYIKSVSRVGEKIHLHWFGGEPLCNADAIDVICSGLRKLDIPFVSSMTTNGFLLNEERIPKAKELWNLKKVQITLDGTEEIYNKAKAYIYPGINAFQTVLNNLKALETAGIFISIRLNAELYNIRDLMSLAGLLGNLFHDPSSVFIGISPLMSRAGAFPINHDKEMEQKLYDSLKDLLLLIESLGFSVGRGLSNSIRLSCCEADSPNAIVIMPDGSLRRCQHIKAGEPVGSINDKQPSLRAGLWTSYREEKPACSTCPFYPTCFRLTDCEESEICSDASRIWKKEQLFAKMRQKWKLFLKNRSTSIEKGLTNP